MTPVEVGQFLKDYGWMGITIMLILGGMTQIYVFGWQFKAEQARRQQLETKLDEFQVKLYEAIDKLGEAVSLARDAQKEALRSRAGGRSGRGTAQDDN